MPELFFKPLIKKLFLLNYWINNIYMWIYLWMYNQLVVVDGRKTFSAQQKQRFLSPYHMSIRDNIKCECCFTLCFSLFRIYISWAYKNNNALCLGITWKHIAGGCSSLSDSKQLIIQQCGAKLRGEMGRPRKCGNRCENSTWAKKDYCVYFLLCWGYRAVITVAACAVNVSLGFFIFGLLLSKKDSWVTTL